MVKDMSQYVSELDEFLKDFPIKFESVHIGLDRWGSQSKPDDLVDHWRVTLFYDSKTYSTEYKTGLGHRKPAMGTKREKNKLQLWYSNYFCEYNLTMELAAKKNLLVPVKPNVADVLSCLLTDASCADDTFEGWCSNFGYETDSRKALDTYLTCQNIRNELIKMFGLELFNKLSGLEH